MVEKSEGKLSEETLGFLDDARKGKLRRFAMICKGTSVVSLVLFKKGSLEKFKKEAKESGKGQFYHGVIDGKGRDITFKLARADGFESAPVKNMVLKEFLAENSDSTFKPTFEIVNVLEPVLDEDDSLVAKFLSLKATVPQACTQRPELEAELNQLCQTISGCLEQDDRPAAEAQIAELERLLGSVASQKQPEQLETPNTPQQQTPSQEPPPVPPTAPPPDPQQQKLMEALKKMRPLVEQAIQADPSKKSELRALISKAAGEIKAKQTTEANASLVALGKLLKSLIARPIDNTNPPSTPPPSPTSDSNPTQEATSTAPSKNNSNDESVEFARRSETIQPRLQGARESFPEKAEALIKVWQFARDQASAQNFPAAFKALDRLEAALGDMLSKSQSPIDMQSWKVAKADWQEAMETVDGQIAELQSALLASEDDELIEIAEYGLNSLTQNHKVRLMAAMFDVDRASGPAQAKAAARCEQIITAFSQHIATSEKVAAVDENDFEITVTIRETLGPALQQLASALSMFRA